AFFETSRVPLTCERTVTSFWGVRRASSAPEPMPRSRMAMRRRWDEEAGASVMVRSVTEKGCIVYCYFSLPCVSFAHALDPEPAAPVAAARQLPRGHRTLAGDAVLRPRRRMLAAAGPAM